MTATYVCGNHSQSNNMKLKISEEKWKDVVVKSTDRGIPVVLGNKKEHGIIVPPHRFVRILCVDCCKCTDCYYCCDCTPAPYVPAFCTGCKCSPSPNPATLEEKGCVMLLTWRATPKHLKNMEEFLNAGTALVVSHDNPPFPCNESNSPVVLTSAKKEISIICVNCREVVGTTRHACLKKCPEEPVNNEREYTSTSETLSTISSQIARVQELAKGLKTGTAETRELVGDTNALLKDTLEVAEGMNSTLEGMVGSNIHIAKIMKRMMKKIDDIEERLPRYETRSTKKLKK